MGFDPVSYLMGKEAGGGGVSPADNGKVVVNGSLVAQTAHETVTENGTYDTTTNNSVTVNVPSRDPYTYPICYSLSLSRKNDSYTGNPTITIDCSALSSFANICNGGGTSNNPGYKKVKLVNLPVVGGSILNAFGNHGWNSAFESLELESNLVGTGNCNSAINCRTLKHITGGSIDLTSATSVASFASQANNLEDVSFVASSIKLSIDFIGASNLTDDSVVSIANGLDATVSAQTLSLNSTVKARCQTLMGTVSDGVFTADASGTVTLADFITTTKGWTLA